ncbi:hypothetical protein A3C57_01320 [Candidatus Nomurabacteria bacterium RIFCSPHIGHO2_02_FULL_33_12]|uniref:Reverse transcriptase domain-containing protein n=1 Tax=Candidatus Nomurabacteria bacterium RIFCSPLOWO2_01_FULL_33_17 TaxID=1801764 RepID=A0A1F6WR39_9BACT|nr:MAG: hypothetical protein A3C57_01320 [Candidatus Nomurabacteria bacterium RIFCSPHIGHO2_02_FULL_33_12]OGI84337.1 MAG: hypothetical protein A2903_00525 [Candidatus Nomurabacteria bacterium RIFCSPLOWO2_01_FULL_33_17]
MRKTFIHKYNDIISVENLLTAWQAFKNGKRNKNDVQTYERNLMENIFDLYFSLENKTYTHSPYKHFKINDPKPRDIHKAIVADRVLHHLLYNVLYPFFDNKFISDSYSCRFKKGTHKGLKRFRSFALKVSKNNTKQCFVLKCDIRKFFANIDHTILKEILKREIEDENILWLLGNIIESFQTKDITNSNPWVSVGKGLPLGNLTSQLFVNIYMNEFDQYMKHKLKTKYYIRYADDFVILSGDKRYLEDLQIEMQNFLTQNLKLEMHPDKVYIKTIGSGVDFLGWIEFVDHRILRTNTKKRMFRNLNKNKYKKESVNSYLGMLKHGNGEKLKHNLLNMEFVEKNQVV